MVSLRLTWLTSFGSRVTWQGDGEEHKTSGRRDGGGHVIFYELARSNFLAIRRMRALAWVSLSCEPENRVKQREILTYFARVYASTNRDKLSGKFY